MTGVVEINNAGGMGAEGESAEAAGSFAPVESSSIVSGMAGSVRDFTESPSAAGGSSARSGSVMSGAFCEEVEDRGRILLAWIMPSSLRPVTGLLDNDETERSFGSASLGCTCTSPGVVISAVDRMVKSIAEEAVDSMVDTAVVAAS